MLVENQIYTLSVETHDEIEGLWLCVDDGINSTRIAQFLCEESAKAFTKAYNLAFAKAHTMGRMGI